MKTLPFDILIVGGGIVGMTLATALAQQTHLSIGILEAQSVRPRWDKSTYHARVSAITLASQRILQALGVWNAIVKKRISPFQQIEVWDATSKGKIQFASNAIAQSQLGFIIENDVLQEALAERMGDFPQITLLSPVELSDFTQQENGVVIRTADNCQLQAKLAVAADGANSWLRNAAGMEITKKAYGDDALVATVKTQLPHQQIARQIFLSGGPLAFLPLAESHLSSIVWSQPEAQAKHLLQMPESEFKYALGDAFANQLGDIVDVSTRLTFPLYKQETKQYISNRLALVGDAAHVIHPLAGQGVNMGMLDAACLAEIISVAEKKHRDFASFNQLRRYERWRKADNLKLNLGVDWLKELFASENESFKHLRSFGLNMTNQLSWVKNLLTRHAVGDRAGLPKVAKQ